jgi:hypothetical protein
MHSEELILFRYLTDFIYFFVKKKFLKLQDCQNRSNMVSAVFIDFQLQLNLHMQSPVLKGHLFLVLS